MATISENFRHRLKQTRLQRQFTQTQLAQALGLNQSTLVHWEKGNTVPNLETLEKLAKALKVSVHWLMFGYETSATNPDHSSRLLSALPALAALNNLPPRLAPPIPSEKSEMEMDLPIYGSPALDRSSVIIPTHGQVTGITERPPILHGVTDAYAMYITGDEMYPRFKHGQLVFVHPHRPARTGDDIVLHTNDNRLLIREFMDHSGQHILTQQYVPHQQSHHHLDDLRALHVIVGAYFHP